MTIAKKVGQQRMLLWREPSFTASADPFGVYFCLVTRTNIFFHGVKTGQFGSRFEKVCTLSSRDTALARIAAPSVKYCQWREM